MKILISSCLLGERVRYHGGAATLDHPILERWRQEGRIVSLCPETAGGLPTPRPPAEVQGMFVRRGDGTDVTHAFEHGAEAALALVREHGITIAVLKDFSPSCGSTAIHDGTFSGRKIPGEGVTSGALRRAGVRVFSDQNLEAADAELRRQN